MVKIGFHLYLRSTKNAAKKLHAPIQSTLARVVFLPLNSTSIKIDKPAPKISDTTTGRRQASTFCKREISLYFL